VQDLKPVRVTGVLALACLAVFIAQAADPFVTEVGSLVPVLVQDGQWWRIATSQLLHAAESHLILNLAGIIGFGWLFERVLGSSALLLVICASAVGSAVASTLVGYAQVLGASGIVHGIVGGIVYLELFVPTRLPEGWRLPRAFLLAALTVDLLAGFAVPAVAGAAHMGGFLAGYAVTGVFLSDYTRWPWPPRIAKLAAAGLAIVALAVVLAVGPLLSRQPQAVARYGAALVAHDLGSAMRLDELAWILVARRDPTPDEVVVARSMATRAVEKSSARDPVLLYTLAECTFLEKDRLTALRITARAISLSGGDRYFIRRRRRLEHRELGRPFPKQARFAPGRQRYFRWQPSTAGI